MMLLLPFNAYSYGYISVSNDSELLSDIGLSSDNKVSNAMEMPCHSKSSFMFLNDQEAYKGLCCDESDDYSYCNDCNHNCTFVKYFSGAVSLFSVQDINYVAVYHESDLIANQFPIPPFRPPTL